MPRPVRNPTTAIRRSPSRGERIATAVLGLLLVAACGAEAEGTEGGPEGGPVTRDAAAERGAFHPDPVALVCDDPVRDFGAVWEGAVLEHEFPLRVEGTADLVIRTTKSDCGCAAPSLEVVGEDGERTPYEMNTPLAPGSRLALHVRYDTRGKLGKLPRNVGLYCNQAGGVSRVTVQADVRSWLVADPNELPALSMSDDEERELHFEVRAVEGQSFALHHVRRAVPEPLTVETMPRDPDAGGRARAWIVIVHLGRGLPRGNPIYPIHLATDVVNPDAAGGRGGVPPTHGLVLRLALEVVGRFRLAPRILNFGTVQGDETVSRTLTLTCLDPEFASPEPRVELVPLKQGQPFPLGETVHLSVRRVSGQRAWNVQVLFDGFSPSLESRFFGRLVIETGHPAEPRLEASVHGILPRPGASSGGSPTPSVR